MRNYKIFVALLLVVATVRYVNATWNLQNVHGANQGGGRNFPGGGHIPRPRNFYGRQNMLHRLNQVYGANNVPRQQQQQQQGNTAGGLREGFYSTTCPNVEEIVRDTVRKHYNNDPTLAAGILRLFFHDCFVRGCDASLLLDRTPSGELPEKLASANGFTLHGEVVIDATKSAVEAACPGIVSCADILSFATRDVAVLAGLQNFPMVAGRRDGTVSLASDVSVLPDPVSSVSTMAELFNKKGFSLAELVVLSGAHSVGGAHCFAFINRLYNTTDPSLDANMANELKNACPMKPPGSDNTKDAKVDFDPASPMMLDTSYYTQVLKGRGLLTSDHALMMDSRSRAIVSKLAADPENWKSQFSQALVKLSKLDVLVGTQGQIRQQCREVNI
ncbi:Peroxidase [Rhynchospora pubera]|uniref:Peroxidase n=1 Tax=Rhynchospora pubera TaxID=906938 RepID=A0AAV8FFG1_9POAL|nr:Peroxidase [Rhynchospora pubera]